MRVTLSGETGKIQIAAFYCICPFQPYLIVAVFISEKMGTSLAFLTSPRALSLIRLFLMDQMKKHHPACTDKCPLAKRHGVR